jgi:uncharacterized protein YjbI with pentapeptide repeats
MNMKKQYAALLLMLVLLCSLPTMAMDKRLKPYANLQKMNLEFEVARGINLQGANLQGANLNEARMPFANLVGANLSQAILTDANFSHAMLMGADLNGANLTGANLDGAQMDGAYYDDKTLFPEGFDPVQHRLKRSK